MSEMKFRGLTLDEFQKQAIAAIENNYSVMVNAPTGSGKTVIAEYIVDRDLERGKRIVYTAPIKALSNQKYYDFVEQYGGASVGLLTGDIVLNPTAPVLIMTTEIYRNMLMSDDDMVKNISYVIFDEIHFISDIERGTVWEESIIFSPEHIRFCCLSATIPNAQEFAHWIETIKKHRVMVITHRERPVPLEKLFYDAELGITTMRELMEKKADDEVPRYKNMYKKERKPRVPTGKHFELIGDLAERKELPTIFFTFSRMDCQKKAEELGERHSFLNEQERAQCVQIMQEYFRGIDEKIEGLSSTKLLRALLPKGIGFHHAGLLPVLKHLVEKLFGKKLIYALYATETFAVGINMPAKTVCFNTLRKFDGQGFRYLSSKEYFQLAGRAGRRGIDKTGKAIAIVNRQFDDLKRIKRFTTSDSEPIRSQFKISTNTVLNLLSRNSSRDSLKVLGLSFYTYQRKSKEMVVRRFENLHKRLNQLEYLKGDELTEKGRFLLNIFVDEIVIGEIFGTPFHKGLKEYQLLLIIASLVYEPRAQNQFSPPQLTGEVKDLVRRINDHAYLRRTAKLKNITLLTGLILPCYEGQPFGKLLQNTNWLEGDLLRFLRQLIDRITQIKKATTDQELRQLMENCAGLVDRCLEGIEVV